MIRQQKEQKIFSDWLRIEKCFFLNFNAPLVEKNERFLNSEKDKEKESGQKLYSFGFEIAI